MGEHRFEVLNHTADIGVEATGESLAEAFENAAYGMFSVMAEISVLTQAKHIRVRVKADDLSSLLQAWLAELIYRMDAERILPVEFKINEMSETALMARVGVCPMNSVPEWSGPAIKAVTYHQLAVEQEPDGWRVRVIFDV